MNKEILFNFDQVIGLKELVAIIVEGTDSEDQVFELIKALELEVADYDFLKRVANYFNNALEEANEDE